VVQLAFEDIIFSAGGGFLFGAVAGFGSETGYSAAWFMIGIRRQLKLS